MKKTLIIIGAALVVALVAAGSFWGGMKYETAKAEQARNTFLRSRGLSGDTQFQGANPPAGGQFGFTGGNGNFRGGTAGLIKSINGNVMTVSTAQNVTTVNLTSTTQIEKSVQGTTADLQPGMRVNVIGQSDSNGSITANRINILNNENPIPGGPTPTP